MSFLRRKPVEPVPAAPPLPVAEEVAAQQFSMKLTFMARSSDGLLIQPSQAGSSLLSDIVAPLARSGVEIIEPLDHEHGDAAPRIERSDEMARWLEARGSLSPVSRHALYLLESADALDMTVDTFCCGLLHGETDTSGYPDYSAIVGGLASHWDELSGDLIVRAVVGWGGKGLRGDTERIGQRLLSALYQQVVATGWVLGTATGARAAAPAAGAGSVCSHCGFETGLTGAFYCPKCGMRIPRG